MIVKNSALVLVTLVGLATVTGAAAPSQADIVPGEPQDAAHAHNDYEHERPLFDALEHGFTSVEADVWLVDGELLVAHDLEDVQAGVTLESLYLDPLDRLVDGLAGSVYSGWDGSFQLLIDIKSDGESTYAAIEEDLAEHRSIMTKYTNGKTKSGPVVAVVSGNRPLKSMQNLDSRLAFYDGRSGDLTSGIPADLMPLVSENWNKLFVWQGVGPMPESEKVKLREYVQSAHSQGYHVRFWGTLDVPSEAREAIWTELHEAGVDHINTDDLAALEKFLGSRS
ncbi:phosphatidylinositol-specific phospholipase C/glycerophosphodiester phosphodiesterase family protein [Cryobacterium sp. TMT2-4]|uniref:phosphatidylinositol-specific phospholipase C/glycerophosphodiester phosphodiesterase family protein n=1 Tax=Cryobacterium sp. TMT2-4 TaxID=1259254 RepID=UPI00106C6F76|nr:phosphatidylinositol-specific phospholipase C/glycerophosphodiester phosphodiesterase family protein [Cryobacterium sp. TMT2-4]TFC66389.1 hypothetical protein E3O54_10920 [Cryobacterium sp. TMT2-4]